MIDVSKSISMIPIKNGEKSIESVKGSIEDHVRVLQEAD
jgi:hypothetical protein